MYIYQILIYHLTQKGAILHNDIPHKGDSKKEAYKFAKEIAFSENDGISKMILVKGRVDEENEQLLLF
ncbi:MAG: hypothetical protein U9P72_02175 [Campylobacterota bacterium]|nr:hypothetical protein [Campylobacterota bacterium]